MQNISDQISKELLNKLMRLRNLKYLKTKNLFCGNSTMVNIDVMNHAILLKLLGIT